MNNPNVFPEDPIQMSNGLEIILGTNDMPVSFGPSSGIDLWAEGPAPIGGELVLQFDVLGM